MYTVTLALWAPRLEFVPICPENVARFYDKIWANLNR